MSTHTLRIVNQLSDRELVSQVKILATHERASTATLIAHIAVMDGVCTWRKVVLITRSG